MICVLYVICVICVLCVLYEGCEYEISGGPLLLGDRLQGTDDLRRLQHEYVSRPGIEENTGIEEITGNIDIVTIELVQNHGLSVW